MYNSAFFHCGDLCLISVGDGADKLHLLSANVLAHFQGPTLSDMKWLFCRKFWTFGVFIDFMNCFLTLLYHLKYRIYSVPLPPKHLQVLYGLNNVNILPVYYNQLPRYM